MTPDLYASAAALAITVNGKPFELPGGSTILDLVERLAVKGRFAVEVNGEIVPRSEHPSHTLDDGDTVEVVGAIGGG